MTRLRYGLNRGWRFRRGKARSSAAAEAWSVVDLPHCWNRTDTFQPDVEYYRGPGVYEHAFETPERVAGDGEWFLCSEGFYGLATLRLNGRRLGRFDGQYLGFECPVGRWLRHSDANELAIELTNECPDYVLPGTDNPDFLLFGGLAGRFWLEWRSTLCFDQRSLQVLTHEVTTDPRVEIRFALSGGAGQGLSTRWILSDDLGRPVGEWEGEAAAGVARCGLAQAVLWSPRTPRLYHVRAELRQGDELLDTVTVRFGLRQVDFTSAGLSLNGEPCELRGFNRHECLPGLGNALPQWLHREDARTIRQLGGNFVRLSHYPQHSEFLDACDEEGLMIYAEIASWKSVRGGRWLRRARTQMESMIRRDRNHPSIVLWGMGNESQHRRAFVALSDIIHDLDPSRPSIYAENHLYRARRARTLGMPDVWGCNYEVEVLDEVREHCRTGAVVISEACNQQAERGALEAERAQVKAIKDLWVALADKEYVAGHALWAFNDYPTMFRRRYVRFTGKFDAWRQPKLAASLFKARYYEQPFVEVIGPWGDTEPGAPVRLDLFTNCARVTVVAGDRQITFDPAGLHRELELPFAAVALSAVGLHAAGNVHCELRPFGPAAALRARALPVGEESDGWHDLRLRAVDDCGETVTAWNGLVGLEGRGPVELSSFNVRGEVVVAKGTGRAIARRTGPGAAVVEVRAAGLDPGRVELPENLRPRVQAAGALEPYTRPEWG